MSLNQSNSLKIVLKQVKQWFYKLPAAGLVTEKLKIKQKTQNIGEKLKQNILKEAQAYKAIKAQRADQN